MSEIIEILVFRMTTRFYSFNTKGSDYTNKEQINGMEVCIAVRI